MATDRAGQSVAQSAAGKQRRLIDRGTTTDGNGVETVDGRRRAKKN